MDPAFYFITFLPFMLLFLVFEKSYREKNRAREKSLFQPPEIYSSKKLNSSSLNLYLPSQIRS